MTTSNESAMSFGLQDSSQQAVANPLQRPPDKKPRKPRTPKIPKIPEAAPTAFCEDASGNLWIGFYLGGLLRYAAAIGWLGVGGLVGWQLHDIKGAEVRSDMPAWTRQPRGMGKDARKGSEPVEA